VIHVLAECEREQRLHFAFGQNMKSIVFFATHGFDDAHLHFCRAARNKM
jgi:hypothetical protein